MLSHPAATVVPPEPRCMRHMNGVSARPTSTLISIVPPIKSHVLPGYGNLGLVVPPIHDVSLPMQALNITPSNLITFLYKYLTHSQNTTLGYFPQSPTLSFNVPALAFSSASVFYLALVHTYVPASVHVSLDFQRDPRQHDLPVPPRPAYIIAAERIRGFLYYRRPSPTHFRAGAPRFCAFTSPTLCPTAEAFAACTTSLTMRAAPGPSPIRASSRDRALRLRIVYPPARACKCSGNHRSSTSRAQIYPGAAEAASGLVRFQHARTSGRTAQNGAGLHVRVLHVHAVHLQYLLKDIYLPALRHDSINKLDA
ncbi:hypothetical protein DFH09DRAFT_1309862 [Mycena vulgaris]|nr:hypothetical protein DFH09DRAFT_1309862 [Mycena vulgaris]